MPVKRTPRDIEKALLTAIAAEVKSVVEDCSLTAYRRIKLRLSGPTSPKGTKPASLSARSSHLRNSLQWKPASGGPYPHPITSSTFLAPGHPKYAQIHETGGTITPKTSKYLTIPIPGGPAAPAGRATRSPLRARDFKDTFFFVSKKGNLLLARRTGRGRGASIQLIFVLKKSVDIPPRPIWAEVTEEMKPYVERRCAVAEQRTLARIEVIGAKG